MFHTSSFTFLTQLLTSYIFHTSAVVKNVASGLLFINAEEEKTESHSVIEKGVEWEYENDNDKETLQTTGPLRHGVLVMVKKKEGNKEKGKK